MQIKQLFQDEDAVSPVIGVILMVAITVILAAVIGTFVLGLGDQVQSSAPNANFQFEYDDGGDGFDTGSNDVVSITHNGGQDVDNDNVRVQIGGTLALDGGTIQTGNDFAAGSSSWSGTISTGSTQDIGESASGAITDDDDVLVIWVSPNGDSSNTIGQSTTPN